MEQTPAQILGVPVGATAEEIKARFRFLSLAFHPDRYESDAHRQAAEEEFKRINEAYQALLTAVQSTPVSSPPEPPAVPEPEPAAASEEWTEEDTANMRNLVRLLGRLTFVVMGGLILYGTFKLFPQIEPEWLLAFRVLAVYLLAMAWFILKPEYHPSGWIRIPVKFTLWLLGLPMCLVATKCLMDSGWHLYRGSMLMLSLVMMLVAQFLFPLEKMRLGRILLCCFASLGLLLLLLSTSYGILILFLAVPVGLLYAIMRRKPAEDASDSEEAQEGQSSDFWKYAAGAAVAASVSAIAHKASEQKARENTRPSKKYCKFCGKSAATISFLTDSVCPKHPRGYNQGKHQPYQGTEKDRYECEYCGKSAAIISFLTDSKCPNHPNGYQKGYHSPAL